MIKGGVLKRRRLVMKILYVCRSVNIGGIPNVLLRAAHGLIPRQHEIHLSAQNGLMAPDFKRAGVQFHPTGPTPFNRPQLALLLKRERFDLIHADNSTAGEDVLSAFQWAGISEAKRPAFVVAVHGLFPPRVTCDPCLPRTDCVIVFDTSTTTRLRRLDGMAQHPITMVRRPVEAYEIPVCPQHPPHFVFVSRLSKSKSVGARAAIEAVAELEKEVPGLHLTIVGEGSQRKPLQKMARALNTCRSREVVRFTGALKAPFPLMATATGVIGTAMVAMEALFHEIPVVAAGYQGYGNVTPDNLDEAIECNFGDAVLEPRPITKPLIFDGMKHILSERNSPQEKAALRAIAKRLQREHSEEAIAIGLERIYQKAVETHKSNGIIKQTTCQMKR
ncbi:Glycosyltransferase involved in cell wall bisynthesis [Abditibacterium utsteinense]|uniref:Glycosyltransferase involved in cell wall bisynthesis n=1 Tax=Abditibacterium utsteinense TaxID=1960156 RepID=A0A2S8SP84_9BACT|nr:glycosyltransferase [Abditibacterium utsteinense]PQV62612.1 Glycosyltransferase involved in cell wall bisynthesis [Abditibacterium utsteinense]